MEYDKIILTADIGGTNSNFAAVGLKNKKYSILVKENKDTTKIKDFAAVVGEVVKNIKNKGYDIESGCFSIAGPIIDQRAKMTNASFIVDAKDIMRKTPLKDLVLINDFEALSYSTLILRKKEFTVLNRGKAEKKGNIAIIGAGTGLGKGLMVYDPLKKTHKVVPSEGGHGDVPVYNEEELKIIEYISKKYGNPVEYEDILSGRGLEVLYEYYNHTEFLHAPRNLGPKEIFDSLKKNKCSQRTVEEFVKFYARAAKNYALDSLSKGGVYIAGGIAAKNPEIFSKTFMKEFKKHRRKQFSELLNNMPVYIITNYDVSLKGAAYAFVVMRGFK